MERRVEYNAVAGETVFMIHDVLIQLNDKIHGTRDICTTYYMYNVYNTEYAYVAREIER